MPKAKVFSETESNFMAEKDSATVAIDVAEDPFLSW